MNVLSNNIVRSLLQSALKAGVISGWGNRVITSHRAARRNPGIYEIEGVNG